MQQRQSVLGIVSLAMSIACGFAMLVAFVLAGILEETTPGGIDEESPAAFIIGLAILGLLSLTMVALGLGIAGFVQRNCSKLFPILGTVFSAAVLLGTLFLLLVGLMMA